MILNFTAYSVFGGLNIVRSEGITLTGADGIRYFGTSGITLTGADGLLAYDTNGITLTGADGITLTGADRVTNTGTDGVSYTGANGITLTGADGITLTGADGITLTGADGITLTGADGTQYHADSILIRQPQGITLTGADGITLTGADGTQLSSPSGASRVSASAMRFAGADGITLTGADGVTLRSSDGITLTGADRVTGFDSSGIAFDGVSPAGITLTGADGITLTGADGITLTGADGVLLRNVDGITLTGADRLGLQNVDPDLALTLDNAADDTNINAVVVYHDEVTSADLDALQQAGIYGGTKFRVLPMVYISGTKSQIAAVSRSPRVRSIYGNRTIKFDSDPYFKTTGIQRVSQDNDLRSHNNGSNITGRNVTVAVIDTGINSVHTDLLGRVIQNAKVLDTQSVPAGFSNPVRLENLSNSDPVSGHGTFVAGVVAGTGAASNGKYSGVAPGAKLMGVSVGDLNLTHVLAGFDYVLDRGAAYNVRVVNCSFSANTIYDENDPVNIATKMLTDSGVSVVVSAGNSGAGNGTLNPYSQAPWVISVGATDQNGSLAPFSSRGTFGGEDQQPTLVAPGVNVASVRSLPSITSITGLGNVDMQRLSLFELPVYTTASGTSFSAPQVSGAIAMMLEANPALTPAHIKDILARTATPLPKYFSHEAGAGMLNTHAAVIEAAFPARRMGVFRSTLSRNSIRFTTAATQSFTEAIYPNAARTVDIPISENILQASVSIAWNASGNDFGLKLYNEANTLVGESNYLNLPGLTERREKIALRDPEPQLFRSAIQHTLGVGTQQNVSGIVETTEVTYPTLLDIGGLSPAMTFEVEKSLLSNILLPIGFNFRPASPISRSELAAAFVRAGLVPQYVAGAPMFADIGDLSTRNAVESVQSDPTGKLFYDAQPGGNFYPDRSTTRLAAAIAFVRAANLENLAATSSLPGVSDASSIPSQWRGYVAVAIQMGYLTLDGTQFNPDRAVTRIEAATALNLIVH